MNVICWIQALPTQNTLGRIVGLSLILSQKGLIDVSLTHLGEPCILMPLLPICLESGRIIARSFWSYVDHICVISLNHFAFRQCGYCTRNSLQWCSTHGWKIESYIQLFQILLLELKNEILKCLEIYLLEREEFWPN